MPPNIPSGHRIDSKLLLKSTALTGYIYIRLLAELPDEGTSTSTTNTVTASITVDLTDVSDAGTTEASVSPVATPASNHEGHLIQCPFDINSMIDTAKSKNLHDPIELIRFLREKIVTGRAPELTSCEEACEWGNKLHHCG